MHAVIEHLKSLETMSWSAILLVAKKHNHHCNVAELTKSARANIDEDWQGADKVLSMRLTNTKRILGIIDRGVLYLLWWDPEHKISPSTYLDRFS